MLFKHINAIGVELEGGWRDYPCECHDVKGDGSVHVSQNIVGEIPIGPLISWTEAEDSIRKHYPHTVNKTCGLHVHISFKTPGHYSAIMSARFEKFLHRRLMAYGRRKGFSPDGQFFQRLDGRNYYCKGRYSDKIADTMARCDYKSDYRYSFLNYCHKLHGTVEVRVLPAFSRVTAAVNAIRYVCESFEKYLSLPGALRPDVHSETSDAVADDAELEIAEAFRAAGVVELSCEVR